MIRFHVLVILFCVYTTAVIADENRTPDVTLHKGENTLSVSLTNNWNRDIHDLRVSLDADSAPSWLQVAILKQSTDLISQENSKNTLDLSFWVTGSSQEELTDIRLILQDNVGNQWRIPISVSVQDNQDYPVAYETALNANYPNPFNPSTTIPYTLRESAHVRVVIYNSLGQHVRTLVNTNQQVGLHHVVWDGCDNHGRSVSSGMYICKFTAGNVTTTRRMLLME